MASDEIAWRVCARPSSAAMLLGVSRADPSRPTLALSFTRQRVIELHLAKGAVWPDILDCTISKYNLIDDLYERCNFIVVHDACRESGAAGRTQACGWLSRRPAVASPNCVSSVPVRQRITHQGRKIR